MNKKEKSKLKVKLITELVIFGILGVYALFLWLFEGLISSQISNLVTFLV